jgi:hypothetical protein
MSEPIDNWPLPHYSAGPRDHLHAVGIISAVYNSFEDCIHRLYRHHFDVRQIPYQLSDFLWLAINENQRIEALKVVFSNCEKDKEVVTRIDNLIEYFQWCWAIRNMLSHAQHYPAAFSAKTGKLHLMRISKRNPDIGYAQFDLATLRTMADRIEYGKRHCARLIIYLRVRDLPETRLRLYAAYADEPLPEILQVPEFPQLSESPDSDPKP